MLAEDSVAMAGVGVGETEDVWMSSGCRKKCGEVSGFIAAFGEWKFWCQYRGTIPPFNQMARGQLSKPHDLGGGETVTVLCFATMLSSKKKYALVRRMNHPYQAPVPTGFLLDKRLIACSTKSYPTLPLCHSHRSGPSF